MQIGDKVHYWSRRHPMHHAHRIETKCHRAIIRAISEDGKFARVERLNTIEAVPVQTVPVKRLRLGWNNWTDQEGRVIE